MILAAQLGFLRGPPSGRGCDGKSLARDLVLVSWSHSHCLAKSPAFRIARQAYVSLAARTTGSLQLTQASNTQHIVWRAATPQKDSRDAARRSLTDKSRRVSRCAERVPAKRNSGSAQSATITNAVSVQPCGLLLPDHQRFHVFWRQPVCGNACLTSAKCFARAAFSSSVGLVGRHGVCGDGARRIESTDIEWPCDREGHQVPGSAVIYG
jgi:hypothetical protein